MANKIQFKRGVKASLPALSVGEPGFCTDTKELFVGASGGNIQLVKQADLDEHLADLAAGLITHIDHTPSLASNVSLYVSTSGSDTTGDGSSGKPYKTLAKALSVLPKNLGGYAATINVAGGTYNENFSTNGFYGGIIKILLTGNATLNSIRSEFGAELHLSGQYTLTLSHIEFVGTSFISDWNTSIIVNNGMVGWTGVNTGVSAHQGGNVVLLGNVVINNTTGNAASSHINSQVHFENLSGNNGGIGLSAAYGGKISYSTNSLSAPTATNTFNGGRILADSQSNIPSY